MSKVIDSEGFYNQVNSSYDDISFKKVEYLRAIDFLILQHIVKLEKICLVDIGSGNGRRLKKILKNISFEKLLLIEQSLGFVKILKENFNPEEIFHGDVVNFQKKSGEFNIALCLWNVIAHADNPKTFLKANRISNGQKSCVPQVVCASKIGCVIKVQKKSQDQSLMFL